MTQLSVYMNPATRAACEPVYQVPRHLASHLTVAVVYSLSGATLLLLATFIRSM